MNVEKVPSPVRWLMQAFLIAVLLFGAFYVGNLSDDVTQRDNALSQTEDITKETCNAATIQQLREAGLLAECQLAQQGELAETVVEEAPATPEAPPEPDPVPDEPVGVSDAEQRAMTRAAVDEWFAENPLPDPRYAERIKAAVNAAYEANPPVGLAPTKAALNTAVRTFLIANPPQNGTNGSDGVGVVSAATEGCDVVFTYSDGSTSRVGPLCGPAPTPAELNAAATAYCEANPDDCRGPAGPPGVVKVIDDCTPEEGTVVTDVDLIFLPEEQTIRQTCDTTPGFPGGGTSGG